MSSLVHAAGARVVGSCCDLLRLLTCWHGCPFLCWHVRRLSVHGLLGWKVFPDCRYVGVHRIVCGGVCEMGSLAHARGTRPALLSCDSPVLLP